MASSRFLEVPYVGLEAEHPPRKNVDPCGRGYDVKRSLQVIRVMIDFFVV